MSAVLPNEAFVMPGVNIAMCPLLPPLLDQLVRVVVDTHAQLPGSFEVTFEDQEGDVLPRLLAVVGAPVVITSTSPTIQASVPLIRGDITSVEAICEHNSAYVVVRGYEATHRLQRAKHTRALPEATDTEAAELIAAESGLIPGEMIPSAVVHPMLVQANQTDWEFLSYRAAEIGYEFGVDALTGTFYFRPAIGETSVDPADEIDTIESEATPTMLKFGSNLSRFEPRVSAANMTEAVEVRTWDPLFAQPVSVGLPTSSETAEIPAQPAEMAALSAGVQGPDLPAEELVPPQALEHFGFPPLPGAFRITDRPLGEGPAGWRATEKMAQSLSNRIGGTFAEAEGVADGEPTIQAGKTVAVDGVPEQFAGEWVVTQAQHVFDKVEGGYITRFWCSGRGDHTLFGLLGQEPPAPPRINGFCCGIVTDNQDLEQRRRVKIALPWLSHSYVSDWARVVQPGAGNAGGALFLPEVGDEVLVGFEFGDIRRPYVLGGLINGTTPYHFAGLGPFPPPTPGETIPLRGFVSPSGNKLSFMDKTTPGVPPVSVASLISLNDVTGTIGMTIAPNAGAVMVTSRNEEVPEPVIDISCGPKGAIAITVDAAGSIVISAGEGGDMTLNGGALLTLKANEINMVSEGGPVSIAGSTVSVAAEAQASVAAPVVNLGA